eukprot:CAMPEP_0167758366 /NCGR_PEP_ID=MMETSP0110_2-20121227/10428_1 /TAXON_ID=629695 /ORGANISM="Gymnochlora sp., Strain CCMP2014" /LENGTH=425 /DNA_ID=CAMNT_0007644633 /DNA_START=154 /DNA_END=1431 /DNA_ORIENTATION=-
MEVEDVKDERKEEEKQSPVDVVVNEVIENGVETVKSLEQGFLEITTSDASLRDCPYLGMYHSVSHASSIFSHTSGKFKLFFDADKGQWIVGLDPKSGEGFLYAESIATFAFEINTLWRLWQKGSWSVSPSIKIQKAEQKRFGDKTDKETKRQPSPRLPKPRERLFAALKRQIKSSVLGFVLCYGDSIGEAGVKALRTAPKNPRLFCWLDQKEKMLTAKRKKIQLRTRNRRFRRMRQLEEEGYFEDNAIQMRAPQLYHEMIGKFSRPAVLKGSRDTGGDMKLHESKQGKTSVKGNTKRVHMPSPRKLSSYLLDRCHEKGGFGCENGSTSSRSDNNSQNSNEADSDSKKESIANARDLQIGQWYAGAMDTKEASEKDRRRALVSLMKERFLQGREPNMDYSSLDNDAGLDDYEEMARDAQEKYFDDQ